MAKPGSSASYWFDREAQPEAASAEEAPRRRTLSPLNLFARKLRAREEEQHAATAAPAPTDDNQFPASAETPAEALDEQLPVEDVAVTEDTVADDPANEATMVDEEVPVVAALTADDTPPEPETPDVSTAAAILAAVRATDAELAPELAQAPDAAPAMTADPLTDDLQEQAAPAPVRRSSRVKTTFLGFEHSDGRVVDVFAKEEAAAPAPQPDRAMHPVGWLAVIDGPGRGNTFALQAGVSQIGRGDDQAIQLNFGDMAISRSNHAAIAFDHEDRRFYLGHGGKTNIVRLNGKPVLSTEALESGDHIRIGETTMRFVALCGPDFHWTT